MKPFLKAAAILTTALSFATNAPAKVASLSANGFVVTHEADAAASTGKP